MLFKIKFILGFILLIDIMKRELYYYFFENCVCSGYISCK